MATMPELPYIAVNRPEPPPIPPLKDRHYHLSYAGQRGKFYTQARWSAAEDAAVWAGAFRSPAETDEVSTDGNYYLRDFGVNPATGQAQRCKGGRNCPASEGAAGTWLPIVGRLIPA